MSLRFAYYGDDFTGSTDVLEALAVNGVSTVLFLGLPDATKLKQFSNYQAIGIAGDSRSQTPEWMERWLPDIFERIRALDPPVFQYKVCSTFDSSPELGNVAVAMRIGRQVFGTKCVPVVVAAPHLRRYVLFANLFAASADSIQRIDRHPTMRQHPVTPMLESDLRLHLTEQLNGLTVESLNILELTGGRAEASLENLLSQEPSAIVFDGLDERSELETGRLLWQQRKQLPFTTGSSGLTYCLLRYWRESGMVPQRVATTTTKAAARVVAVSGSCSPMTETQIQHALHHGFESIHTAKAPTDEVLRQGLAVLARGRSLIIYSALGPDNLQGSLSGEALGRELGTLLRQLTAQSGVRRAVIAGGDTASHAARQLGIHALTFAAVMAPGAPLCRAHSDEPSMDGLELVLKGGQVGNVDFFEKVLKGEA